MYIFLYVFFNFSNILWTDIFKYVKRLFFSTTLFHYVDLSIILLLVIVITDSTSVSMKINHRTKQKPGALSPR